MTKILCITDPKTHPEFDTTFHLYNLFAEDPRIDFYHLPVSKVDESLTVRVVPVSAAVPYEDFLLFDSYPSIEKEIAAFDLILNRADRPYADNFLNCLAAYEEKTKFLNSPRSNIIFSNLGAFYHNFKEFIPDSIFTRDVKVVQAFFEKHDQKIVAKKNMGYGGKWVYKIWQADGAFFIESYTREAQKFSALDSLLEALFSTDADPFLFVRYLKNVHLGDKRILVVGGEIYGAYVRKSTNDSWINNISVGGVAELAGMTERELEVIAKTAPKYLERGLMNLGYDFLVDDDGSWILSEINSINIGGFATLEKLTPGKIYGRFIDWLIKFAKQQS